MSVRELQRACAERWFSACLPASFSCSLLGAAVPRRLGQRPSSGLHQGPVQRRTRSQDRCRRRRSTSCSPARCPCGFTSMLDSTLRRTHTEFARLAPTDEQNTAGASRCFGCFTATRRILFRSRSPKSAPNDPFSSGSPVRWEMIIPRSRREGRFLIPLVPAIQMIRGSPIHTSGVRVSTSPKLAVTPYRPRSQEEAAGLSRSALASDAPALE